MYAFFLNMYASLLMPYKTSSSSGFNNHFWMSMSIDFISTYLQQLWYKYIWFLSMTMGLIQLLWFVATFQNEVLTFWWEAGEHK